MQRSYCVTATDPAGESVRRILRRLFAALRSNVEGVLENADVESLHDLRVATRRTRTALSETRRVLPPSIMDIFPHEFKWIADVTGPCRDLDVMLLELDGYRHRTEIDDRTLGSLKEFLEEKQRLERGRLQTALQSVRFQRLVEGWSRVLDTGAEEKPGPPLASQTTIDVAGRRILKAYRRMWKRGTQSGADPPAVLLHRLRIDGKKLRYLLEFFSELYPRAIVARFVRELKQLQDVLGDFNDTGVQLTLVQEFIDHGTVSAETRAAARRLTQAIEERQRELRAEIAERFAHLASDKTRKLYKKTFKTSL